MLSTKIRDDARLLLQAIQAAGPLLQILEQFSEAQRKIDEHVLLFASGGHERNQIAMGQIHGVFGSISSMLSGRSLRDVFRASGQLIESLNSYGGSASEEVANLVRRFDELLDTYGTSHSMNDGALVVRAADQLLTRLLAMENELEDFASRFDTSFISYDEDIAYIGLTGHYELSQISEKLAALDDICKTVRNVLLPFQISTEYRVHKIETGSLSIEIVAKKIGIFALKRVLAGGISYIHRNYTSEGQLKFGVHSTSAALKDALKLRNALAKEGVNVEGIDEALAQQTEMLVKKIGVLSGFEGAMRVNDEMHVRLDESEAIALSYSTPKIRSRLGHDKDGGNGDIS